MLRKKKTAKKIWIVLAILILPAFVFWGFGYAVRGQDGGHYAGKILGRKVSFAEYRDSINAVRSQYKLQLGSEFYKLEKFLDLPRLAWDRLAMLKDAASRGLKASDQELTGFIQSMPLFQVRGAFNDGIYEQILKFDLNVQPRAFEEQMRQQLALSKLFAEFAKGASASDEELRRAFQKETLQISIAYLASTAVDFTKSIAPGDEEIQDYFRANSLQFKQPMSFNIEYLTLDTEEKAKEAFGRLDKKESLPSIAKALNTPVKESGLFTQMGPITGIGWNPEMLNAISKAKVNTILAPMLVDKNYYLIRIKERKEPYVPELSEIKDKVKEAFIGEQARKLAREKIDACLKKIKENVSLGGDFEKLAPEYGLKAGSTPPFKFGSYIEGIGMSDDFWAAALELKENEIGKVIETPAAFYIIKVKSRDAFDEKKFETEKLPLKQRLLSQKQEESFNRYLQQLRKNIVINLP